MLTLITLIYLSVVYSTTTCIYMWFLGNKILDFFHKSNFHILLSTLLCNYINLPYPFAILSLQLASLFWFIFNITMLLFLFYHNPTYRILSLRDNNSNIYLLLFTYTYTYNTRIKCWKGNSKGNNGSYIYTLL